jgi:hypothetical protein
VQAGDSYNAVAAPEETLVKTAAIFGFGDFSVGTLPGELSLPYGARPIAETTQGAGGLGDSVVDATCAGNTLANAGGDGIRFTPSGLAFLSTGGANDMILAPGLPGLDQTEIEAVGRYFIGLTARPYSLLHDTTIDGMAVNLIGLVGNYSTFNAYSGVQSNMTGWQVSTPETGDYDPSKSGTVDPDVSTVEMPGGLFDAATAENNLGNLVGLRGFAHQLPDGRYVLVGFHHSDANGDGDDTDPWDWSVIVAMQQLAPPTVPDLTGIIGNEYVFPMENSGSSPLTMKATLDHSGGMFKGEQSDGQLMWGTLSTLASGFEKVTLAGSTVPRDRASPNSVIYGLEIPGTMLLVVDKSSFIAGEGYEEASPGFDMGGACIPYGTTPWSRNILLAPDPTFDQTTADAYGVATFTYSGTADLNGVLKNLGTDYTGPSGGGPLPGWTCTANPPLMESGVGTETLFLSTSGFGLLEFDTGESYLMAPPDPVTAATLADAARAYVGAVVRPYDDPFKGMITVTQLIRVGGGNGVDTLTGSPFANVETNTLETGMDGTIVLGKSVAPPDGMFDASTIDNNDGTGTKDFRLVSFLNSVTGKHVAFGMIREDVDDNGTAGDAPEDWEFVVLKEK